MKEKLEAEHKKKPLPECYFLKYHRDEHNDRLLRDYLGKDLQFFEMFKSIILDLPALAMSIDLDSDMERRHFLIPDGYMLFRNWEGIEKQSHTASK